MHRSRDIGQKQEKTWQAKNGKIRNLQTLESFFLKTARIWEKFMRTKVVEREISDRRFRWHVPFVRYSLKTNKMLSFKSSTFRAQIVLQKN